MHLSVLGGGAAGLATGFYARKQGLTSTIYEAGDRVGGHCATIRHGSFHFDLGAHRFHDKNPAITVDVKVLMGTELTPINIPSKIYDDQTLIDFPLSTVNLLKAFGPTRFAKAGLDILTQRLRQHPQLATFEQFARYQYGRDIAKRFVLGYSEKLWGVPCDQLSSLVSGNRLKGLTLFSLLRESLSGQTARSAHLDGSFLYPKRGYGSIIEGLARHCGEASVRRRARVSAILHDGLHIEAVEINGTDRIPVDHVVSTLPLPLLIRSLKPAPSEVIVHAARQFAFRDLILVALMVKRRSVTTVGSLYFPDPAIPFTRISEPRNRSPWMAPAEQTSLLVELPCRPGDHLAVQSNDDIVALVSATIARLGLVAARDITDAHVVRTKHAYPVLTVGVDQVARRTLGYLGRFSNLSLLGRNATFEYLHLHEIMNRAKSLVTTLCENADGRSRSCTTAH